MDCITACDTSKSVYIVLYNDSGHTRLFDTGRIETYIDQGDSKDWDTNWKTNETQTSNTH